MSKNTKECYENRELSWLKFNERVLEEAADKNNPLCERLTFLSIYQSNLDEFFMVRVGSLIDQKLLDEDVRENKTYMTAEEQIDAVLRQVTRMMRSTNHIYDDLMDELERQQIRLINFQMTTEAEEKDLQFYFEHEMLPLLSAFVVGKKQSFPFLNNKAIYALAVLETKNDKNKIGIVPCNTGVFNRLISIPGRKGTYILAEELILHYLPKVFPNYRIGEKSLIRITRNADIDADSIYDEDLDYREHMVDIIKRRKKLTPVRLEYTRKIDGPILDRLCTQLGIERKQTFYCQIPMDMSFFSVIQDTLRHKPDLFYPKRVSQKSPMLDEFQPLIPQIIKHDVLLSFPYEQIRPFLNMLHEAASDPDVVSIKMTLYRLARHSKVVEALIEAAENGKQVDVLVELKARFDEENNIEWSRQLEDAGCHVIYGLDGLKVHSKLCLITRKTEKGIDYITQIGTGNYNEKTARLYTDLSLITARPEIGMEASRIFQALSLGTVVDKTEHLLVSPKCLQKPVLEMIDNEIAMVKSGQEGYIGIKINSLTDKKIIAKLIEASEAGVKIDMVIRGICCLRSGIEDLTDNIRIISIVGRFLEHSRIYIFGTEARARIYIASADFMTRNTTRRVEVAVPIEDVDLRARIQEMFITMLSDNVKAREQQPDGTYVCLTPEENTPLNSQEYFFDAAYAAAENNNFR
ncbi:polyphosphate kinase 1 [Coprococcus catus]|uniref:polyphosphate kinase 1 n=1 Tax=Coprococcus catus TaxID=116085 RepID=UPI001C010909|nr:polyphosphate kinase 1 [Coprococcus catus]MBT9774341.1 polyphosphate kinase 1 [Coprococcus catus]